MQKRFHVAGFGPADITNWVINSFSFVKRVVTTRAIGPRNPKIQFFVVEQSALNIHAHGAYGHNNATVADDFSGEIYQIAAGSVRRNQHRVHATACGMAQAQVMELRGGDTRRVGTTSSPELNSFFDEIGSNDPTTGGLENLNGKLSQ